MSETADLCRVVLVTPYRTVELALPANVPLCDLLPVLVQRATTFGSPERPAAGRGRGRGLTGEEDWVIQRLGSGPLDEELTPAALQVRDGETLYLRPRDSQLPPAHFDDLIDGLATGVRGRADRWRESMTRLLFLALGLLALGVCLVLLLDRTFQLRGGVAAGLAVLLVIGAAMFSRALGDDWGALLCGLAALPYAALAGFLVPEASGAAPSSPGELGPAHLVASALPTANPDLLTVTAPALLTAFAAATATAVLTMTAVGEHRPVFLAMWLIGLGGTLGALLVILGLTPVQAAGAVVTLALIVSTFAPSVAFRLARLRLPQLPTGASDLSEDIEPYPGPQLMAGAAIADTYLTWMLVAVGAVGTASVVMLARHGGGVAYGMVVALSVVLLIRSRGLTSAWQRVSTLLPALTGLTMTAAHFAAHPDERRRLLLIAGLVFLAGAMFALSRMLPARRLLPYWGRLADAGEYLAAGVVMVLLLWLLDAYQWARALAG